MANEKTFNTRIKLRRDTYDNWMANDPVLLAGEVAICTVEIAQEGSVNTVPSTLIKIGDGTNHYSELDYISSKAADVYAWAKAATKPKYAATEITGLETYINQKVQDTNTTYTIVKTKVEGKDNDYQYKLMSKEIGEETYTKVVATIDIPNDTEAIEALEASIETLNGDAETEGSVNYKIAQAVAKLTDGDGDENTIDSINELITWVTSHDAAVDALNAANRLSALEGKVGNESVETQINTAIEGLSIDNYAKDADLAAVAKSGLIDDLSIGKGTTLIFDCGTSATSETPETSV